MLVTDNPRFCLETVSLNDVKHFVENPELSAISIIRDVTLLKLAYSIVVQLSIVSDDLLTTLSIATNDAKSFQCFGCSSQLLELFVVARTFNLII